MNVNSIPFRNPTVDFPIHFVQRGVEEPSLSPVCSSCRRRCPRSSYHCIWRTSLRSIHHRSCRTLSCLGHEDCRRSDVSFHCRRAEGKHWECDEVSRQRERSYLGEKFQMSGITRLLTIDRHLPTHFEPWNTENRSKASAQDSFLHTPFPSVIRIRSRQSSLSIDKQIDLPAVCTGKRHHISFIVIE